MENIIYTANESSNNVSKIKPGGVASILANTLPGLSPNGIAVDSNGNVYTANAISSTVSKITPGGAASILSIGGGIGPVGIAIYSSPIPKYFLRDMFSPVSMT